ncbi:hypothetical protein DFA_05793 [Cavenderia fasciculata]|uniref:Ubiquitin-like domain-containing protein n=1 Tax=Cavenderia fasciculata TaxID=261658 RepID=F4PML2_CACFS|nr:uncharacterized protein DFA_05793 [Cavenderia fasciculata]EGG23659.1 hypothetical protein DFA_05793 [Cavenderia fasciculata]|eukprot:XP_004361510.1 hypothetical protein DFA_05793 [Cavenderia fasciculata]
MGKVTIKTEDKYEKFVIEEIDCGTDSLDVLKSKWVAQHGEKYKDYIAYVSGDKVEDTTQTLKASNIYDEEAVLFVNPSVADGQLVIVICGLGRPLAVVVPPTATVGDLRTAIQDSEGIPPDNQILSFRGARRLDDNAETLKDLEIENLAKIFLRLQLGGGVGSKKDKKEKNKEKGEGKENCQIM